MPIRRRSARDIHRVLRAVGQTLWAIEPGKLEQICELLELRAVGCVFDEVEIRARIGAAQEEGRGPYRVGPVAVLPLHGVLAPRMNLLMDISGGTSTEQFAGWLREALADEQVRAIVLDVNSPGGSASGNEEVAQQLRAARGGKPIVAVATDMMASAAYYIGSAADEVVASPSAELGSIGTYMVHGEHSRADANAGVSYSIIKAGENKAAGNPYEPLTSQARAVLQERVNDANAQFVAAVAANRGVSSATVEAHFGQGRVMLAPKAVAAGLADRIGTLEQIVTQLASRFAPAGNPPNNNHLPRGEAAHFSAKEQPVNPRLRAALIKMGLISADASEPAAQAALHAWFAVRGQSLPPDVEQTLAALEAAASPPPAAPAAPAAPPAPLLAHPPAPTPPTSPPASPVPAAEVERIRAEERARIEDLTARAQLLGIGPEALEQAVANGLSVRDALLAWTDRAAERGPARRIDSGRQAPDKFAAAAVESLSRRAGLAPNPQLNDVARDLEHRSLLQLAELSLSAAGVRTCGSPDELAATALRGGGEEIRIRAGVATGFNRPSDFPNLMSSLMGRSLEQALEFAPATYREWAAELAAVPDFRPKTLIATGEFGEFPRIPDGDDFEDSSISEEASWIAVDSYGDEWSLTPRMIIDDDLGALMDAGQDKQIAHEMTLNRLAVNLLTGNAVAGDGVALFHDGSHGNDITSGAAPGTTQLAAMRLKLRKQSGVSGRRKLNLGLKTLLIPEDLETTTEQLLAATLNIMPTSESGTQIFRGRVGWVVEPMLGESSAAIYYGFADKRMARAIVYCHQRGFEGMVTRNYFHPKNNSRVFQFEGRFAAAIRNWRGVVRNAGA